MKRIFVTWMIIFLVLPFCSAQYSTIPTSKFDVHVNITSLSNLLPTVRVGVEYITDKQIGYSLDLGYGFGLTYKNSFYNFFSLNQNLGSNYSVYEFRPEIKFYLKPNNQISTNYIAWELFYNYSNYHFSHSYFKDTDNIYAVFFDEADFIKQKFGYHIKYGWQFLVFKHFKSEIYAGIGIAYRNLQAINVVNPVEDSYAGVFIPKFNTLTGNYFVFNQTAGIKLGYRF